MIARSACLPISRYGVSPLPALPLFVLTLLISSSLLFLVQPMFARMILPALGGSPGVWNTCMVFFQAMLLAGYLYAHLTTRWLGVRRQVWLHVPVLLLPWLVLPIGVREGWRPAGDVDPLPWLLMMLTLGVGLPFFVVATSAPLLQRWFSRAGHADSDDPYFLYAASNIGSMAALLAYPLLVEPLFTLEQQSRLWSIGYGLLIALGGGCALVVLRQHGRAIEPINAVPAPVDIRAAVHDKDGATITCRRLLRWIALAFVPSSLMLGVTTHITTDLVVVPLLWVIPLALYLLTFILVFARRRLVPHRLMVRLLPIIVVALVLMFLSHATQPIGLIVLVHLAGLFIIGMVCHGELADDRPAAEHLTTFYLMMGLGGVLGGAFNGIAAPLLFDTIIEYRTAIVFGCLLCPFPLLRNGLPVEAASIRQWRWSDLWIPALVGGACYGAILISEALELGRSPLRLALIAAFPALACYLLSRRPIRFGLAVAAVLIAGSFDTAHHGRTLLIERSFFGVHRVTRSAPFLHDSGKLIAFNQLYHGTTLHGSQRIDIDTHEPRDPQRPLGYYHDYSPIGRLMRAYRDLDHIEHLGVVGLGAGTLAAYARPGQTFTFFEIDPLVQRIAEDERYFTFLSDARRRGVDVPIVLGDARLTLGQAGKGDFDLLILDAFSSDAIPVHLLTVEATRLYESRLAEGGVLAFHISNRYLDLEPLLAALATELDMRCLVFDDTFDYEDSLDRTGWLGSKWAVFARDASALEPLRRAPEGARWLPAVGDADVRVWTDDYSNILSVFHP